MLLASFQVMIQPTLEKEVAPKLRIISTFPNAPKDMSMFKKIMPWIL